MRKSLRMLWLPTLVLAVFAMGCAQTCPPMRHGALGQAGMSGPQCCAAHAGCDQMQAGCASMGSGCAQGMAGCKSMGPGCGQKAAGCASMKPGCGQPGAGMQACGPRDCSTVIAPSEWGPKPSLDDYLRGCCLMGGRGLHHRCGPDRCGPGPRAACGPSCKHGPASMGCGTRAGMGAGRPSCATAPANRTMCAKPGAAAMPSVPRRCATTQ